MPDKLLSSPTKNAIQKTLAAQLLSTATTTDPITFDDVDGLPNLPGVLVIRRVDTSNAATPAFREYIEYSGTSGTTVLITTRNVDGSNAALTHPVGSIVEFIPDVTWADRIYDALSNVVSIADLSVDLTKVVTPSGTQTLTNKGLLLGSSGFISSSGATVSSIDADSSLAANSDSKLATQKAIKAYVDANAGSANGWTASSNTWVYATASTFTIAGVDRTAIFTKGTRLKFTQTTVKYAVVVSSSFSTNTTVTIAVNTDHTIANAAITLPFYSYQLSPEGYPGTFNWATTWGGFSANPTGTFKYSIGGNIVSVYFTDASGGTSNATTLTFTVPVASLSAASAIPCFVGDNGANVAQPGHLQLGADSATVSVYKSFYQGAFTNVNGKGLFFKLLQYDF